MTKHWPHAFIPIPNAHVLAERAALVGHLLHIGRPLELLRLAERALAHMRWYEYSAVLVLPEGWAYHGRPIMFVRDAVEFFRLDVFEAHKKVA